MHVVLSKGIGKPRTKLWTEMLRINHTVDDGASDFVLYSRKLGVYQQDETGASQGT